MRALQNVAKGVVKIIEMEAPVCTEDTFLVKNIYSGMSNGTERNVMMGGNYGRHSFPDMMNYQPISTVVEVGKNIKNYKIGDIMYDGTSPGHVEYHLLKEDDLMVKLPEDFDLLDASLLGVASVSFHNIVQAGVNANDNVLVFGAGLIGQFAAQAARVHGAIVTVTARNEERLKYAKELGADRVVNISTDDGKKELESYGPYSMIFDTTGADILSYIIGSNCIVTPKSVLEGNNNIVGFRCRLILTGGRDEVKYDFNAAQVRELMIMHMCHFDQSDLNNVVRLVLKGSIKIKPLITKVVPFAESLKVFETLRDNPGSLMGTVIDWRE